MCHGGGPGDIWDANRSSDPDVVAVQEGVSGEDIRVVVAPMETDGPACITSYTDVGRLASYVPLGNRGSDGHIGEGEDGNECKRHGAANVRVEIDR